MKKIIFFILVSAALFLMALPAHAISWESDLAKALKSAEGSNKPLMVDFYTDWCGWCKKLDSNTYSDKTINDLSAKFICVKVNADKARDLTVKYGVRGYPTIIFLNSKGDVEQVIVGYADAASLKQIMEKVLAKSPANNPAPIAAQPKPADRPKGAFVLGGIMGSDAIVNDKIVKVGATVDGAKVVEIARKKVRLDNQGKEITLCLED